MTPRKISIHQVGLGSSVRDAAADTMPVVRQMLGELGFNSEIFVDGDERSLRLRAQDLLLIHHCGFQGRFDWLAGLRGRKALIYHGMTPPRYFVQESPDDRGGVALRQDLSGPAPIATRRVPQSGAGSEVSRHRAAPVGLPGRGAGVDQRRGAVDPIVDHRRTHRRARAARLHRLRPGDVPVPE